MEKMDEERELLIGLLERCFEKIFADQEARYFSTLYRICFPFASTFVLGRNGNQTLRWLFRSADLDAHVQAITLTAFPEA
jgi:hypothetical protein